MLNNSRRGVKVLSLKFNSYNKSMMRGQGRSWMGSVLNTHCTGSFIMWISCSIYPKCPSAEHVLSVISFEAKGPSKEGNFTSSKTDEIMKPRRR